eukprot:ctg_843.g205
MVTRKGSGGRRGVAVKKAEANEGDKDAEQAEETASTPRRGGGAGRVARRGAALVTPLGGHHRSSRRGRRSREWHAGGDGRKRSTGRSSRARQGEAGATASAAASDAGESCREGVTGTDDQVRLLPPRRPPPLQRVVVDMAAPDMSTITFETVDGRLVHDARQLLTDGRADMRRLRTDARALQVRRAAAGVATAMAQTAVWGDDDRQGVLADASLQATTTVDDAQTAWDARIGRTEAALAELGRLAAALESALRLSEHTSSSGPVASANSSEREPAAPATIPPLTRLVPHTAAPTEMTPAGTRKAVSDEFVAVTDAKPVAVSVSMERPLAIAWQRRRQHMQHVAECLDEAEARLRIRWRQQERFFQDVEALLRAPGWPIRLRAVLPSAYRAGRSAHSTVQLWLHLYEQEWAPLVVFAAADENHANHGRAAVASEHLQVETRAPFRPVLCWGGYRGSRRESPAAISTLYVIGSAAIVTAAQQYAVERRRRATFERLLSQSLAAHRKAAASSDLPGKLPLPWPRGAAALDWRVHRMAMDELVMRVGDDLDAVSVRVQYRRGTSDGAEDAEAYLMDGAVDVLELWLLRLDGDLPACAARLVNVVLMAAVEQRIERLAAAYPLRFSCQRRWRPSPEGAVSGGWEWRATMWMSDRDEVGANPVDESAPTWPAVAHWRLQPPGTLWARPAGHDEDRRVTLSLSGIEEFVQSAWCGSLLRRLRDQIRERARMPCIVSLPDGDRLWVRTWSAALRLATKAPSAAQPDITLFTLGIAPTTAREHEEVAGRDALHTGEQFTVHLNQRVLCCGSPVAVLEYTHGALWTALTPLLESAGE